MNEPEPQDNVALTPILNAIDEWLNQTPRSNEHDLIKHCQANYIEPFVNFDLRESRSLFCAHFLMMHALYTLQGRYRAERSYLLEITSVSVIRSPFQEHLTFDSRSPSPADPLREYYLDITHYFETSEADVNQLLNSFWKRFLRQDDKRQALAQLDLPLTATLKDVKARYRKLAQSSHPDKGGDEDAFKKLNAAKELLCQLLRD